MLSCSSSPCRTVVGSSIWTNLIITHNWEDISRLGDLTVQMAVSSTAGNQQTHWYPRCKTKTSLQSLHNFGWRKYESVETERISIRLSHQSHYTRKSYVCPSQRYWLKVLLVRLTSPHSSRSRSHPRSRDCECIDNEPRQFDVLSVKDPVQHSHLIGFRVPEHDNMFRSCTCIEGVDHCILNVTPLRPKVDLVFESNCFVLPCNSIDNWRSRWNCRWRWPVEENALPTHNPQYSFQWPSTIVNAKETRNKQIWDSQQTRVDGSDKPLPMVNRNEWNYAVYRQVLENQPQRGSNHCRSIWPTRHACPHREWSETDHPLETSTAWHRSHSRQRDFWCSSRLNHYCRYTIQCRRSQQMGHLHGCRRFEGETEHKDRTREWCEIQHEEEEYWRYNWV